MALPNVRPVNEWVVTAKTASVGTTPVAAWCVAPVKGKIVRTYTVLEGTITGTAAIAVAINGGADIGTGAFQHRRLLPTPSCGYTPASAFLLADSISSRE